MVWAVLVAVGVAVVSMTLFGAKITRRPTEDRIVEEIDPLGPADASDPWAAWKPRPFEELDRPRPRMWPVLSAFTGIALVGAGFAGARQTIWTVDETAKLQAMPKPYTVQVDIPATPTLKPTPKPTPVPVPATPAPTAAPASTVAPKPSAAATAAPTGSGPVLSGSSNCTGGRLSLTYSAKAGGSDLSWVAVWVDGKAVKGGPISGQSYGGSYSQPATPGDHDLEVSVEDKAGRTSRKQFQSHCA
jgi:hypothetical protein